MLVANDRASSSALARALEACGVSAELASPGEVAQKARASAPAIVAALDGTADEVRSALARDPLTRVIFVDEEVRASADAHASALVALAASAPDRVGAGSWPVGGTLVECIDRALAPHACGLLSVRSADRSGAVLLAGALALASIERMLERVRPLAARGDRVSVAFHESARGSFHDLRSVAPRVHGRLEGRRVVLLSESRVSAEDLGQALAADGANMLAIDPGGTGVGRARALAPDVIVADEELLDDLQSPATSALRGDTRLSWAAIVAVPREVLALQVPGAVDVAHIVSGVHAALEADAELTRIAATGETRHARLEATGPLRLLRALARAGANVRTSIVHAAATVEVELEEGLVVGAQARGRGGETAGGHAALATLLTFPSGRVHIEPAGARRFIDIMASLDDAIAVALRERPRIRVASHASARDVEPARADASEVVRLLEARLETARAARGRAPFVAAATVAERAVLPTEPPPPAMDDASAPLHIAALDPDATRPPPVLEPRADGREQSLADLLEPTTPEAAAPPPAPPPSRSERRGRALAWVALVVALTSVVALAYRASRPTPILEEVLEEDTLSAAFDEADTEAEADVPREAAAEAERAIARPPSTLAPSAGATTSAAAPLDVATIDAMILRGNFARHHGDPDLAARYYRDVLAADPTNARALVGLARVLEMRGDLVEATRVARTLRDTHGDHPANHVLLADLLLAQGDRVGARTILEDVTSRFPRNEPARERLRALDR